MKVSSQVIEQTRLFFAFKPKFSTIAKKVEHSLSSPLIHRNLEYFASKEDYVFCIKELHTQCQKLNIECVYDELNLVYHFRDINPYGSGADYAPIIQSMNMQFNK